MMLAAGCARAASWSPFLAVSRARLPCSDCSVEHGGMVLWFAACAMVCARPVGTGAQETQEAGFCVCSRQACSCRPFALGTNRVSTCGE
ncbi:hypothetical protein CKAH01_10782 [Colletotrichum kahawae]|uniref:Uncharacterized protein n=1 Tax=Colletotrichum kahawae TaxID=34407 RepID=A0AAD9XWF1_COLKA|nr:hypothetical protein CKAH01_10782 [Colletotrichum kahawae]